MILSETFTLQKYVVEMNKGHTSAAGTTVTVRARSHVSDDATTLYEGDVRGFKLFVDAMVNFHDKAERFDKLEVPRL